MQAFGEKTFGGRRGERVRWRQGDADGEFLAQHALDVPLERRGHSPRHLGVGLELALTACLVPARVDRGLDQQDRHKHGEEYQDQRASHAQTPQPMSLLSRQEGGLHTTHGDALPAPLSGERDCCGGMWTCAWADRPARAGHQEPDGPMIARRRGDCNRGGEWWPVTSGVPRGNGAMHAVAPWPR